MYKNYWDFVLSSPKHSVRSIYLTAISLVMMIGAITVKDEFNIAVFWIWEIFFFAVLFLTWYMNYFIYQKVKFDEKMTKLEERLKDHYLET